MHDDVVLYDRTLGLMVRHHHHTAMVEMYGRSYRTHAPVVCVSRLRRGLTRHECPHARVLVSEGPWSAVTSSV